MNQHPQSLGPPVVCVCVFCFFSLASSRLRPRTQRRLRARPNRERTRAHGRCLGTIHVDHRFGPEELGRGVLDGFTLEAQEELEPGGNGSHLSTCERDLNVFLCRSYVLRPSSGGHTTVAWWTHHGEAPWTHTLRKRSNCEWSVWDALILEASPNDATQSKDAFRQTCQQENKAIKQRFCAAMPSFTNKPTDLFLKG